MKTSTTAKARSMRFDALPDWMTVDEARKFLRLGRSTIYERIRRGEIHARRFGRQFRISKNALCPSAPEHEAVTLTSSK